MRYHMRVFVVVYIVAFTSLLWWWKKDDHVTKANGVAGRNVLESTVTTPKVVRVTISVELFRKWFQPVVPLCNERFTGYAQLFAKLKNVILDSKLARGQKGGENISEVLNQNEESEFYKYQPGFFRLPCSEPVDYVFKGDSHHLNSWMRDALLTDATDFRPPADVHVDWTIAITRYEYANMYHTMTDFYNAFLMLQVFNMDPDKVTILIIDGHPSGQLDVTWSHLFGKVKRISDFPQPVLFKNMVWSIVGYESPLDDHFLGEVPYVEEFREFFLTRYKVPMNYNLNCRKLNILLIWRHNYVAHPRNPSGRVSRKIANEGELLEKFKSAFPGHSVRGIQIDVYPMKRQLNLIARTDILVGMHGAGLSHAMFLPPHAGLVEMFPSYYTSENRHFIAMATWRKLHYRKWENFDYQRETYDESTRVDVDAVADAAVEIQNAMCTNTETNIRNDN